MSFIHNICIIIFLLLKAALKINKYKQPLIDSNEQIQKINLASFWELFDSTTFGLLLLLMILKGRIKWLKDGFTWFVSCGRRRRRRGGGSGGGGQGRGVEGQRCRISELRLLLEDAQLLHALDVLLQHDHVVRVLLARHVNAQIARHVRLVVANVAAPRRFGGFDGRQSSDADARLRHGRRLSRIGRRGGSGGGRRRRRRRRGRCVQVERRACRALDPLAVGTFGTGLRPVNQMENKQFQIDASIDIVTTSPPKKNSHALANYVNSSKRGRMKRMCKSTKLKTSNHHW